MALIESKGNMYSFVKTWNPLAGECPHACGYCSTQAWKRFPLLNAKYTGELRLDANAMKKNLGKDNTWFVCGQNDLFANKVPHSIIRDVLERCNKFDNVYFFQTKNPERYVEFYRHIPSESIICTTIETNRTYPQMELCPSVANRAFGMWNVRGITKQVTIEPIMDFDLKEMVELIKMCEPLSVNIGADSKGHHLPEPSKEKVLALIDELKKFTVIDQKRNLGRILDK